MGKARENKFSARALSICGSFTVAQFIESRLASTKPNRFKTHIYCLEGGSIEK